MKKNILLLVLISVFLLAPAMSVVAAPTPTPTPTPTSIVAPPVVHFLPALGWIVNFVFFIFMTVAVIFIIVAAFQFLTAAGDAEAIKKARTSILYAVIAIVVAVMAQGIIAFIRGQLEVLPA